jgi:hypothetical protein
LDSADGRRSNDSSERVRPITGRQSCNTYCFTGVNAAVLPCVTGDVDYPEVPGCLHCVGRPVGREKAAGCRRIALRRQATNGSGGLPISDVIFEKMSNIDHESL